jgi:hypothetical protein
MNWPLVCVDNFFNDPVKVVEFANNLNYSKDGRNPGVRTVNLDKIDYDFFHWVNIKILSVMFPNEIQNIKYVSHISFAKVPPNLVYDGWVHTDQAEFTAIVYLSNYKNCGTKIYNTIKPHPVLKHHESKLNYFNNPENIPDNLENLKYENNCNFEESIIIKSRYNRLLIFDSHQYHSPEVYISDDDKERLTLIGFFQKIESNFNQQLKFPISEMRRI